MTTVTLDKAEKELAELLQRARAGEEVVITDGHGPGVRLSPVREAYSYRGRGSAKHLKPIPDAFFFDPLPDDELALWEGGSDDPVNPGPGEQK
jgi:antitoxin (DNA-binding transcriptional repressor) of toxin-antitoxin stability system